MFFFKMIHHLVILINKLKKKNYYNFREVYIASDELKKAVKRGNYRSLVRTANCIE